MPVKKSTPVETVEPVAVRVRPRHPYARVGELWRSQGKAFLDAQAEILIADVDRLRESYLARHVVVQPIPGSKARRNPTTIIDLRDGDVGDVACNKEGHSNRVASARCVKCRYVYCAHCIVRPEAMDGAPICTQCALALTGVSHKRARPLTTPGRVRRTKA